MRTKLVRVGDGHGIAIDAKLLGKLGFKPDMQLELTVEDGCLVVGRIGAVRPRPRPRVPLLPPPRREPRLGFPKKQPW
jgi:antitoxin component of MazEF toxin-antitoxin module